VEQGYALRAFAREIGVSGNFLSEMERGRFAPPSEGKIALIAEKLGRNTEAMLALAGKGASDVLAIILQRPKAMTAVLRRLQHAPAAKVSASTSVLAAAPPLDF
jgi:transcriptional regulator with XRE-family HTH domain